MVTAFKQQGTGHDFQQIGDGRYRLTIESLGTLLEVDRLRRERHELIGELSVTCDLAGAKQIDGYIHVADFNVSSAVARQQRAKILAERSDAPDLDWFSFIEELATKTIRAEREGAPSKPLHLYEDIGPEPTFDIHGWPLLRDHATIAFGDGGSLKSYLALYAAGCLAQRGVRVLYADWELTGSDHKARLRRIFGSDLPVIDYLHCDRPLIIEADRIGREVRRLSSDYWIADSIAFAVNGRPEEAEHATAYFRATRQIGMGSLHLAHTNKSEHADEKPFGSAFWHNAARATWFVRQASASIDRDAATIGLFNKKANLTRRAAAVGFEFAFCGERVDVTPVTVAEVDELAADLPLWQRMKAVLSHRPLTLVQLAADLGANVDTVDKTVRRKTGLFTRVPSGDGVYRIALLDGRRAG